MTIKIFKSPDYNFVFNTDNGFFARWGKDKEDDPEYSPFGPEILDIELSTICHKGCKFCYKSNMTRGKNMSFETFQSMFDKFPKQLTQVAFGIGDIDANPELWKIMGYCREKGVIPNITINGERMTPELYDRLVKYCGAIAVSFYDKDTCYNAVKELTNRGMTQVNIHCLLAHENYSNCLEVLSDRTIDSRLEKLNAVVFLVLKRVGRGKFLAPLTRIQYETIINMALDNDITVGFDSCSAPYFLEVVKNSSRINEFKQICEPCESSLFSLYIDVDGVAHPCSFSEHEEKYSVNVLQANNFVKDVWFNNKLVDFRINCLASKHSNGCRKCSLFNLGIE